MTMLTRTTTLLLLSTTLAQGQTEYLVGSTETDTAFDVLVLPTHVDRELDMWRRVPHDIAPKFTQVSTIHPFQPVQVILGFKAIGDTGDGRGRVTFSLACDDAVGSTEVLAEDASAWDGELPPPGIVVLGPLLELAFDEDEPLGPLLFRFEIHDAGSGRTLQRDFELELAPWSYGDEPGTREAFESWYGAYHVEPRPAQAVRALFEHGRLDQPGIQDWNYATLGFFRALFDDQRWLVDHLVTEARGMDERLQKASIILHVIGQDERIDELFPGDPEAAAASRARVASITLPDAYAPAAAAAQLDLLWGEFFATGRYRPLRQLAGALALMEDAGALDTSRDSARTEADSAAALRGAIFGAAAWSLGSNIRQHERVRDHVTWMIENDDSLPAREKAVLAVIRREALAAEK